MRVTGTPRPWKKVRLWATEGGAEDILTKGNDQEENGTRGLLKVKGEHARDCNSLTEEEMKVRVLLTKVNKNS